MTFFQLTKSFKALVSAQGLESAANYWVYISAADEAGARARLEKEGYDVHELAPVFLTHLGGEVVSA